MKHTRYTAKEYEPKKQRINIENQDKIHTNTANEKEQKSSVLNTVTKKQNQEIDQNKTKSKELKIS